MPSALSTKPELSKWGSSGWITACFSPTTLTANPAISRCSPGDDHGDPLATLGSASRICFGDRRDRADRGVGRAQVVDRPVVGVLVGDEHRGHPVERLALRPDARVDHDVPAVVADSRTQEWPNFVILMVIPTTSSTKHQRHASPGSAERMTGWSVAW